MAIGLFMASVLECRWTFLSPVLEPLERLVYRFGAQLIKEVWGPDRMEDTRGLRAYIKALRQKIEPTPAQPRLLVTEPGLGYRLLASAGEGDSAAESEVG